MSVELTFVCSVGGQGGAEGRGWGERRETVVDRVQRATRALCSVLNVTCRGKRQRQTRRAGRDSAGERVATEIVTLLFC